MLRIRYILTVFVAFLITGLFLFYLLSFRSSSLYSMMILDKCYHKKDLVTLKKYCSLEVFSDSVMSHLMPINEVCDTSWKATFESLQKNNSIKDYETFYYNIYCFLKENFGNFIYIEEVKENTHPKVNVFYKPFSSGHKIKLELIFSEKEGAFQLQYIKNLKEFLLDYCTYHNKTYIKF